MIQDGLATGHAHILVRLDANHHIGLGHAVRVSGILRLLKVPHRITVAGAGELITDFFPGQRLLPVYVEDPNAFFSLVGEIQPDLILVDHPRPGHGFWHGLSVSAGDIPVVSIDDEGGEVNADLVINGTVLEQYHRYPLLRPRAKLLAGSDYSLIRPAFGETPWRNPTESSVVIVAGSGDRAHDWALHLLSGKMDLSSWGAVRMVVGRAFPDLPRLKHDCDALGVFLESGLSGEDMAEALSQASVALITGGMIVYEALAVGVPAIVFPQIENLIPEAQWFAERGCIVNLGHERGSDCGRVSAAVGRLLGSPSARLIMSVSQRATIDGHGMVRAAQAIDAMLADRTASEGQCTHREQKARP